VSVSDITSHSWEKTAKFYMTADPATRTADTLVYFAKDADCQRSWPSSQHRVTR